MKILMVNHEAGGGGASHSLLELTKELLNRGHEIYMLTPYADGPFAEEIRRLPVTVLVEPYWWWRIPIRGIKLRIKLRKIWFRVQKGKNDDIARRIAEYALDQHIDIIHSNTSAVNIGALISKYSGIPHVWHLREFGDLDMGMYFLAPGPGVYSFMNRYTQKFICISNAVAAHYTHLDSSKKIVVYNGVSEKYLTEQGAGKENETVNILIAGMLCPFKGQKEAVEACRLLLQRGTDRFILHIAGRGDLYFDIPEELKDHVQVHGEISDMRELRKSMDIELVCSEYEAFGRVTAEAMLGGLAVIGSDRGGTPELIRNGENGYLYEKGNAYQLCSLLEDLIRNPELRNKIGKNAQDYAGENFLMKRCADEIENIYKTVLNKL